ncbi:hypothetical protein AB5J52_14935 [Streptomyces sp. R39]|uniref:Uncharacterized protein n=1 Tax=Streptomyces sp. R39 TaxID=3238631 RepID=A0AB39QJM3_9ACTN
MDFAPPPGELVDDAAVLARLAAVAAALEQLRRAAAAPVGEHSGAFLNDVLHALPTRTGLPRTNCAPKAAPWPPLGSGTPSGHYD